ncbi:transposase [Streptomyces milbemycinicus]
MINQASAPCSWNRTRRLPTGSHSRVKARCKTGPLGGREPAACGRYRDRVVGGGRVPSFEAPPRPGVGVGLFYLPPRSPELNDIERVWRSVKYEDYPERVHTTAEAVATAIAQTLNRQRTRIKRSAANFTKAA